MSHHKITVRRSQHSDVGASQHRSNSGFMSSFSSHISKYFSGRNSADEGTLSPTDVTAIRDTTGGSYRDLYRKSIHQRITPTPSTWSWNWKRRTSRQSISATTPRSSSVFQSTAAALGLMSNASHSTNNIPFNHQHILGPKGLCSVCEQYKNTMTTSMRERVIESKKVPEFLIPTTPLAERKALGGSFSNLKAPSMMQRNSCSYNKFPADARITESGDYCNTIPTSDSMTDVSGGFIRRSSSWRRGSIPSALGIYGTLQNNELIKRSSTDLINELVEIIVPERKRCGTDIGDLLPGDMRSASIPGLTYAPSNGELFKVNDNKSLLAASNASFLSNRGVWESQLRCITSVRFEMTQRRSNCLLSVFLRRLHNSAPSATFYSTLKLSVTQWKFRLIVATRSCKIVVKKKHTINGQMPLEENLMFSNVKLPRLSKLLKHNCSVWLRLQLCHRPISDDDYDDHEDGMWQSRRQSKVKTPIPQRTKAVRTQRFPPFFVFVNNIKPISDEVEWAPDVECPSVQVQRREKQQQPRSASLQQPLPSELKIYSRSFAAFPCSSNSTAAFDRTLLTSKNDKRNMVIALLSVTIYAFSYDPVKPSEPLNILIDVKEVRWKKPAFILSKFLDFWLFAKTTLSDGKEEKAKTGMRTSRIWKKSEMEWRIRSICKRGNVKSLVIKLSGRTINSSQIIATADLSESSEEHFAAQLFHTIFRHAYKDEHYNLPAETLPKSLLVIAGDGDENNPSVRKCFSVDTVLPLVSVP